MLLSIRRPDGVKEISVLRNRSPFCIQCILYMLLLAEPVAQSGLPGNDQSFPESPKRRGYSGFSGSVHLGFSAFMVNIT